MNTIIVSVTVMCVCVCHDHESHGRLAACKQMQLVSDLDIQ